MLFFGTPFRGTNGLNQSEMLWTAKMQYEESLIQDSVLNILAPGNEMLIDLMQTFFETRQESHKALVACFYELKPSNLGAIVGGRQIRVSHETIHI